MNSVERRIKYLDLYRRQLRRETDAMGYGQRISSEPIIDERLESARSASWQIIPAVLVTLGLVKNQLQASK